MSLPTEPGLYETSLGEVWLLRDDRLWQNVGRRLPLGGVALDEGPVAPLEADAVAAGEAGTLPVIPVALEEVPRWWPPVPTDD